MLTTGANRIKNIGETVGGRLLQAIPVNNSSLLRLHLREGGVIPVEYQTHYGSVSDAVKAGEKYLREQAAYAKAKATTVEVIDQEVLDNA